MSRGLYVPADAPRTTSQRIVEAAARLPPYAALGGWAAAYWMGVRYLDGQRNGEDVPVPLNIADGTGHIRAVPGALLLRTRLESKDIRIVRGLPVTLPVRIAFDGARLAETLTEAVIFLDMMFAAGLVSPECLREFTTQNRAAWKGVGQVREALARSTTSSRSPQETRLRLIWTADAELPTPQCNVPVFTHDGNLIAIPDLLDVESGLIGEYDGEQHRELEQHTADNVREELLESHGFVVVRATRLDLRNPLLLAHRLRMGHERALRLRTARRSWTLQPPTWYPQAS